MHFCCDIDHFEPALRLLVTSDGTVTDMLQAVCRERINVRKLAQEIQPAVRGLDWLDLPPGELLMSRRVLLQGDQTGTTYIYADSCIAIDRLDVRFQQGLLRSDTPIGRLWRDNRLEVFKEIIGVSIQAAGHLARHFGTGRDANVLVRTCRVFVAGRPAMLIAEYFSPAIAASIAIQSAGCVQDASWSLNL
jgi:chorismate-pyruvate lyase